MRPATVAWIAAGGVVVLNWMGAKMGIRKDVRMAVSAITAATLAVLITLASLSGPR